MEERIASTPAPRTAAEYRAAIDELLAEMKRMNQQSDRTPAVIEMTAGGQSMEEQIASSLAPKSAAEYEAAINELLAGIRRMNTQMDCDREEIERLKAETERIKAETETIKARLQSRLDDLMARV